MSLKTRETPKKDLVDKCRDHFGTLGAHILVLDLSDTLGGSTLRSKNILAIHEKPPLGGPKPTVGLKKKFGSELQAALQGKKPQL